LVAVRKVTPGQLVLRVSKVSKATRVRPGQLARSVRLGQKAIKGTPEKLEPLLPSQARRVTKAILEIQGQREQRLPYPGQKVTKGTRVKLGRRVSKVFPVKLGPRAQLVRLELPGQKGIKGTRAILATLGLLVPSVRLAQPEQQDLRAFRVSKAIPETRELYQLPLPLLTTRKLGLYLYLRRLSRSTEPQ
jgi:hypothetical protein